MTCVDDRDPRFEDERWLWLDEAPDADDLEVRLTALGPHLWHKRKWCRIQDIRLTAEAQQAL